MLDCSFANSKDVPTPGLLAQRFLPLGLCFIPVGLQVPMDGPLSCYPSYYRKGPRIGPNRRDHQLDSWPSLWPTGIPGSHRGEAERGHLPVTRRQPTMLHFSRVRGNRSESASSLLQMHPSNSRTSGAARLQTPSFRKP